MLSCKILRYKNIVIIFKSIKKNGKSVRMTLNWILIYLKFNLQRLNCK